MSCVDNCYDNCVGTDDNVVLILMITVLIIDLIIQC